MRQIWIVMEVEEWMKIEIDGYKAREEREN